MNQPLPEDSSESEHYSPVPYGELDALRFKAELEVATRKLEDVSKKAGITELEWEDQRKQLLATSTVYSLDCSSIQSSFCY
jgi:tRNA A37 threonylcarbamoyladenosine biosynthesis protein TsaE